MSKEEIDIDEEIEKLSRKTNVNIKKAEFAFEKQIKKLDNDIDNITKQKIKSFDDNKKILEDYLTTDYSSSSIDRYREKLKKI